MIVDLNRFIAEGRPRWERLGELLRRLERDPGYRMELDQLREFHSLYQRTSADLARIATFSSEPETRRHLETLVGRTYAEIHQSRDRALRLRPARWLLRTFPRTFRRHLGAFWLATALTVAGGAFGGLAVTFDPAAKEAIIPFSHLSGNPAERVAFEEGTDRDRLKGRKATFSTQLMTHNAQVSLLALALGMTWGVGTVILLFHNGVILGAVALDYVAAGQTPFLLGWLLPHGVVEIPAILIAGQAGLLLAGALIGWGDHTPLKERFRKRRPALVTLIGGVAVLLAWAGLVEAFLSQYHQPVISYGAKITVGVVQLVLLVGFLCLAGRDRDPGRRDG